ncbi:MAG TPA: transporter associated domain-containing protein, partial [Polyangiaceae bacterium]|nr:transporter associated domain-containing protein [Polyangiaceae bacterium]
VDDVVGVAFLKDLVRREHEGWDDRPVDAAMRPAYFVPESKPADELLREMQAGRQHLAIVIDEYGGTAGLVTIEDVLEEIVGEIEDESDRVDPFVTKRADGSLVCRGWAEARAVLGGLGVDTDDVEAVTVGGLVAELVGRVPRVGDRAEWRGLEFIVLQASPRRAERVEIRRMPDAISGETDSD